jgi:hypothetical protein
LPSAVSSSSRPPGARHAGGFPGGVDFDVLTRCDVGQGQGREPWAPVRLRRAGSESAQVRLWRMPRRRRAGAAARVAGASRNPPQNAAQLMHSRRALPFCHDGGAGRRERVQCNLTNRDTFPAIIFASSSGRRQKMVRSPVDRSKCPNTLNGPLVASKSIA